MHSPNDFSRNVGRKKKLTRQDEKTREGGTGKYSVWDRGPTRNNEKNKETCFPYSRLCPHWPPLRQAPRALGLGG